MPWEHIGDCGASQIPHEEGWVLFQLQMGIDYLKHVCGDPPPGCELGVMWHEHELGEYPAVGLCWEFPAAHDAPWDYIARCEIALEAFNGAVNWSDIHPDVVREQFSEDEIDEGMDEDGDEDDE